jgi:hypothetical protein
VKQLVGLNNIHKRRPLLACSLDPFPEILILRFYEKRFDLKFLHLIQGQPDDSLKIASKYQAKYFVDL